MEPKLTTDAPDGSDQEPVAQPLPPIYKGTGEPPTFKVLCESVVPAFVGYFVTFRFIETKQVVTLPFVTTPNYKEGVTYECVIR